MDNLFDMRGKCVAITGGGGILCGQIAADLANKGAKVALWNITLQKAEKVADRITKQGATAAAFECNVLDKDSIVKAVESTERQLGEIDILINGAGGNRKQATTAPQLPFFDLPDKAVMSVFDLNFMGTFFACQVLAKGFADRGKGIILNVSSMNAFQPLTKIPAYSAAKAAVSNFTQWLAVHMCQNYSTNIRVNAIAPGFFLTKQNRFLLTDEKTGQLTARGKTINDHTPMARFGKPEDLSGTVLWLISDASKFVTGIVVPVDGGFSAYSGV